MTQTEASKKGVMVEVWAGMGGGTRQGQHQQERVHATGPRSRGRGTEETRAAYAVVRRGHGHS